MKWLNRSLTVAAPSDGLSQSRDRKGAVRKESV